MQTAARVSGEEDGGGDGQSADASARRRAFGVLSDVDEDVWNGGFVGLSVVGK